MSAASLCEAQDVLIDTLLSRAAATATFVIPSEVEESRDVMLK